MNRLEEIHKNIDICRITSIAMDLIRLRSDTTGNMEYEISLYLKRFLEEIGAVVELQHVELKRYNVIGRFKGDSPGKTLMYCGHIDIVPPGDLEQWDGDPFSPYIKNGLLYGRGSVDMKGSIASILHTVELIKKLDISFVGDILLVLNVDEEVSNKGIYKFFNSGIKADACIVGEPSNMEIALGHRGVLGFRVKFRGKRAHASQPQLGVNPIRHAMYFAEKVDKFSSEVLIERKSDMGNSTMTITYINAGKELNSIPDECEILVDRRLITGETKESVVYEFEQILQQIKNGVNGFEYDYEVTTYCPPGEVSSDNDLVRDFQYAINPLNPDDVPLTFLKATCEASVIANNMEIPVVICGPGDMGQAHIVNEFIELKQLELGSKIYASFILRFLR